MLVIIFLVNAHLAFYSYTIIFTVCVDLPQFWTNEGQRTQEYNQHSCIDYQTLMQRFRAE